MFDKLKQLGDLKKMRDQAMAIQKQLAQETVEVEESGIKIIMTGDQKVEFISIDDQVQPKLVEVLNKAIKKSQEVAARKLQEMGGGLGGLLG
ncbi:MAG: YbaB/EbfC family nucleoid-associated protein [Candidatus Curtissbacteria bacterium]|nr:YbaB/EbfC family nucleoid-associated protein [Candidatus Curtissbacteria bacterium]